MFGKLAPFGVVMIVIVPVYTKLVLFLRADHHDCIREPTTDTAGFFISNSAEKKIKIFLDLLCSCVLFYYVSLLRYFLKLIEN